MLFFAIILCLISSIEILMSSAAIGYHSGDRCDSNKDLVGQGIGNLVAGIVCALPGRIPGQVIRQFEFGCQNPVVGRYLRSADPAHIYYGASLS